LPVSGVARGLRDLAQPLAPWKLNRTLARLWVLT